MVSHRKESLRCLGIKLGQPSQAHPGSRSNHHSWIERSGGLDSAKRDRDQYDEVAQRKSLRFLVGIKPQQQNKWAAGAKLSHAQSCQSCGNNFAFGGDVVGQTNTPLGSFYRRKRAQLGAPKAITATARKLACLIYRLIKNGQAYKPTDLRTYELKYKQQTLDSLRKRAKNLGFDLVQLPKAA